MFKQRSLIFQLFFSPKIDIRCWSKEIMILSANLTPKSLMSSCLIFLHCAFSKETLFSKFDWAGDYSLRRAGRRRARYTSRRPAPPPTPSPPSPAPLSPCSGLSPGRLTIRSPYWTMVTLKSYEIGIGFDLAKG